MSKYEEFTKALVSFGEEDVRLKLSQGVWANRRKTWAQDWLANQDASRENHRAKQELDLSREANEIARSALNVSRSARFISIIAIVVSVVTAIVVAVIQFIGQKPS